MTEVQWIAWVLYTLAAVVIARPLGVLLANKVYDREWPQRTPFYVIPGYAIAVGVGWALILLAW